MLLGIIVLTIFVIILINKMLNTPDNDLTITAWKPPLEKEPFKSDPDSTSVIVDHPIQDPPRLSTLDIDSEPRGARVVVGDYVGWTRFRKDSVEVKSYKVRLSKEGFKVHDTTTSIREGKIQSLFVKLISLTPIPPSTGNLTVSVKPEIENNTGWIKVYGAKTFVEDHFWGPFALKNKKLAVGICSLAVEHPHLGLWRDRIEILGGKEAHIDIDFQESIEIWIDAIYETKNERANIFIDGKKLDEQTPIPLLLRVGLHKIRVTCDGFTPIPIDTTINVKNGAQIPGIIFKLKKL